MNIRRKVSLSFYYSRPQILVFLSRILLPIFVLTFITACGGGDDDNGGGGGNGSSCTPGIPAATKQETSYCSPGTFTIGAPTNTITGAAQYEFRPATAAGLGPFPATASLSTSPIRNAEIRVTNSSGTLVQCAETNDSGNFNFVLPADGGTYTIAVTSRANNTEGNASVLNSTSSNDFYSITASVTTDTTNGSAKAVSTMTAEGKNTIVGGAFNILDQIITATKKLKTETAACGGITGPSVNCSQFDPQVAPTGKTAKVTAYWAKGFNPNEFFCNPSSGLSFYLPSANQLFILGGINGDTDSSDTDHFDNSVILHEYGHFLEDQYASSDSPGGSHNGNSVIDPRLAWSEGWANFFQAAITGNPVYQDTSGNSDGETGNFFFESLELRCDSNVDNDSINDSNDKTASSNCTDLPSNTGEGNFREFSISRVLWDSIDAGTGPTDGQDTFAAPVAYVDTFSSDFSNAWTAFQNLRGTDLAFRSVGLFHEVRNALGGVTDDTAYNELVTDAARQQPNRIDYANPIDAGSTCTTILASSGTSQFNAHDYYDLDHAGGSLTLNLTYSALSAASDVDIYLYNSDYVLFSASTIVSASTAENDGGSESISISSLAAGRYLIDVHYFAGLNNQEYVLKKDGVKVCPQTSF